MFKLIIGRYNGFLKRFYFKNIANLLFLTFFLIRFAKFEECYKLNIKILNFRWNIVYIFLMYSEPLKEYRSFNIVKAIKSIIFILLPKHY